MAAAPGVRRSMAVGRVVAAPNLPALQADAQMQPLASRGQALLTTLHGLRQPSDSNAIEMSAGGHLPTQA
jgi:hypothetical protein